MIDVPPDLLWDYPEAPPDELWRLRRIADFFPRFGRDRATVEALHARRDELAVAPEIRELIDLYFRLWTERDGGPSA